MNEIHAGQLKEWLGRRPRDAHKGTFGRVLVLAGSQGMAGAAILAGRGAYRAGAGLVVFGADENLFSVFAAGLPEAICRPRRGLVLDLQAYDAVCLGPGLGTGPEASGLVERVLAEWQGPLVLDADALNIIAGSNPRETFSTARAQIILTPHPGEASRLLGRHDAKLQREETVRDLAGLAGGVALLKGAGSLIAAADLSGTIQIYQNPTGNPGMATAGAGDVLAGLIAALCARGLPPLQSALAGAYLHGLAGDLAAASMGETGMTAGDITTFLPQAFYNIIGQ